MTNDTVVTGRCSWCHERVLSRLQSDGTIVYGCEYQCRQPGSGKRSPRDPESNETFKPGNDGHQRAYDHHLRYMSDPITKWCFHEKKCETWASHTALMQKETWLENRPRVRPGEWRA